MCSICLFVTDLFHLVRGPQVLSMLYYVSESSSFLRLNNIPLCMLPCFAYPIICQWTRGLLPRFNYCEQRSCEHGCTNFSSRPCFQLFWAYVYYSEVELLGHMVFLVFIFEEHTVFHHFDVNCSRVSTFPHLCQYCYLLFF